jgi:valyl-tRNA synthetase
VINEMGADALRFALLHGPEPSQDQRMSPPRLEDARNFANKLWNAARFVLGSRPAEIAADAPLETPAGAALSAADEWILQRCAATLAAVDHAYAEYQFGEAARLLYDAIWSDYCDWYLEMAKPALAADATADARTATWRTLTWVLDRYLRLLHPLMPHVTEAIWQRLPHAPDDPDLLIVAPWPDIPARGAAGQSGAGVEMLKEMITAIRGARAESGIAAADIVDAWIYFKQPQAREAFESLRTVVERLARIRSTVVDDRSELAAAGEGAMAVIAASGEARVRRSDSDRARERTRLDKELANARAHLGASDKRLADDNFVGRAPAAVVDQARRRAAELRDQVTSLTARLEENS